MQDEMERLRAMLERQTGWGKPLDPEPVLTTKPASTSNCHFSSDLDDDEVLSYEHRVGGSLENAIGHDEVHETLDFPQYNLQFAQEAPEGEVFCSLKALQKYPYNFVSAASREKVARQFFDSGSFYERPWDFFYIHAPYSPSSDSRKSIVLIPSRQFQHFLVTMNNTLGTHLKLPDYTADSHLLFEFPKDGTPRPRYLGQTDEREMAECLKKAIPSSSWRPDDEAEAECKPTEKSLAAFKKKIELLLESDKKKKGLTKEKKKIERFAKQRAWSHEIKRVQRYLGLREAASGNRGANTTATDRPLKNSSSEWARNDLAEQTAQEKLNDTKAIDIEKPAPYTQEGSVIFVCVDVEAYERDHNRITEVGIATLDTADINIMTPGKGGTNWMKAIRARHFRIREHGHLKNQEFINGCAEHFQFGESEWISIMNAPQEISRCFKPPYSKKIAEPKVEQSDLGPRRNIILVGHDIMTDINYLKKIGYDPSNLSNLQELIDTSSMYRALKREPHPRNLGSILATLDITGWYLHNAGNDAVYTLQAMIGIAITALLEPSDEESREKESEMRIAESVQNAVEAAQEAQQGWSSEGSDGGLPLAVIRSPQARGSEQFRSSDMPWRSNKVRFDSFK